MTDRATTLLTVPDAPMVWHGWGDPTRRAPLDARARAALEQRIGPLAEPRPPVDLADVRVAASALSTDARAALVRAVGREHVVDDHRTRVEHAGGKSYPDLLRRRHGEAVAAPDAVVRPRDHEQVAATLAACRAHGVAVVPFGGGTSVVGGVEPERGGHHAAIALDLRRMRALVSLDEASGIATLQPGLRGAEAEALLRERGWTLGHYPQSYAYATIGGYVATRSAGQASTGYGRIDDLVIGVRMATPAGTVTAGGPASSAAGPDLLRLLVGSEGALGVITEVRLQVRPAPQVEDYAAFAVPSFSSGAATLRSLERAGLAPDVVRLSDEDETDTALTQRGGLSTRALRGGLCALGMGTPCLLVLGWEGGAADVARRRDAAREHLAHRRTVALGASAGWSWARGRFDGPYLRDELMDRGALVETLETATSWARLGECYHAVRTSLTEALAARGTPPLVLCHVSHCYPTGASLYFTFIARQQPGAELAQWHAAKAAASDAILASGGTITHHHAVGTDHRAFLARELDPLVLDALRAVKSRFDPEGICNPGKLLPLADDALPRHDDHW